MSGRADLETRGEMSVMSVMSVMMSPEHWGHRYYVTSEITKLERPTRKIVDQGNPLRTIKRISTPNFSNENYPELDEPGFDK